MRYFNALALSLAVTLTACGGGGGGGGNGGDPTPPGTGPTFSLQAGYRAKVLWGSSDTLAVSGDCTGTATFVAAPSVVASFEVVPGYSASSTSTYKFTDCTPAESSDTSTSFYDVNFSQLGSSGPENQYSAYESLPTAIPTSVRVGDTGQISTLAIYSDATKTTVQGRRVLSYAIESDTATTAVLNLIAKSYNPLNDLIMTQQTRYRIAPDGSLTLTSIDLQYSTISTMHLVMTKL